jgi:hypothetical protein
MYPFPIRIFDGCWNVLMAKPNGWIQCNNHRDALTLSGYQVLINQAASNRRGGKQFSLKLCTAAGVLDRYGKGFAADLCRYYAKITSAQMPVKGLKLRRPR